MKKAVRKNATAQRSTAKQATKPRKPAPRKKTAGAGPVGMTAALAAPRSALLFTSPVGNPQPFSTKPSESGDDNGSSTTSGLKGTSQNLADGSLVIEATEQLTAKRVDGLNSSLTASCRRVQQGDTTIVHQVNYSYKQRVLSDCTLMTSTTALSPAVPAGFQPTEVKTVKATQFGKNDRDDEGTGSPDMGLIQTNSEVFGGSVKVSVMTQIFGAQWRNNSKRLAAMIDVLFADKKRMIRVPLVDVGPGEHAASHAEVDLTWASDQFLGTQGGATVSYRILIPT
jgi:hypothetical protein